MTDKPVSTNNDVGEHFHRWVRSCFDQRWSILALTIFTVWVAFMTFTIMRIHVTYGVERDVLLNRQMIEHHDREMEAFKNHCNARLDAIEQTLFGQVVAKLEPAPAPAPRVSRLETWQQNTSKELRTRMERIERRLLQLER